MEHVGGSRSIEFHVENGEEPDDYYFCIETKKQF